MTEQKVTLSQALSKVPEITVWFWIIKILCTTVGETFADWISITLGLGLIPTALIFSAVLVIVTIWQMALARYVPLVYWLTVVVLSITGTLYTDILTDHLGVPLALSTAAFASLLAIVFGVWFARERTLSIHSITTPARELFYWTAVLVTFALGTAVGDWTLELTGWGPGTSVLLPVALIALIAVGWRLGANAVLSFWLAYILTRPLGANLGDWLGLPGAQHGLGWGVAFTSLVFVTAILVIVAFLTVTKADVIGRATDRTPDRAGAARERLMLGYYVVVAVATVTVLVWASGRPHAVTTAEESETGSAATVTLVPGQSATAKFPRAAVDNYRSIVADTLAFVRSGDHDGALARIKDLETAWDADQSNLVPLDEAGWSALDTKIDTALSAVRAGEPDQGTETRALIELQSALA